MKSDESYNQANQFGMTPLHLAAIEGDFDKVASLLALGADPTKPNQQDQLPIFSALVVPMITTDAVLNNKVKIYHLLQQKAPDTINHQDENGETVLHQMAIHGFSTLMSELLKANPKLAYINNHLSRYPIHTAILNNQADCVRILLQEKDVATLADSKGKVALHYAASYSGEDILNHCCNTTNNLDITDMQGRTPVMLAARAGNDNAIKILIQKSARVDITDHNGWTIRNYLADANNLTMLDWLSQNMAF